MLKFPPLKRPSLTNYLTYKTKFKNTGAFIYKMFDNKGKIVGEMTAFPETIYDSSRQFSPHADSYRSFYIKKLMAFERNKGVGTAFINIAKKESLRNFCFGNIHVISSARYDQNNPPHIFYRKMGFQFNQYSKATEKYIDECLQNHRPVEKGKCIMDSPMYIAKNIDKKTTLTFYNLRIKFPEIFGYK